MEDDAYMAMKAETIIVLGTMHASNCFIEDNTFIFIIFYSKTTIIVKLGFSTALPVLMTTL